MMLLSLAACVFLGCTAVNAEIPTEKRIMTQPEVDSEVNRLITEEFGTTDLPYGDHDALDALSPGNLCYNDRVMTILKRIDGNDGKTLSAMLARDFSGRRPLQPLLDSFQQPLVLKPFLRKLGWFEDYMESLEYWTTFKIYQVTVWAMRKLPFKWNIGVLLAGLCKLSSPFSVSWKECSGGAILFAPAVLYILDNSGLSSAEMVATYLGGRGLGKKNFMASQINWKVDIPAKPETLPVNDEIQVILEETTRFVHLTDVHLDLQYQMGLETHCDVHLCCRHNRANMVESLVAASSSSGTGKAGRFGELHGQCNIPTETARSIATVVGDAIRSNEYGRVNYILWTVDSTPHDIWATTETQIYDTARQWTDMLTDLLPENVPVFPLLGNHEAYPVNMFAPDDSSIPDEFRTHALYATFYDDIWSKWFNDIKRMEPSVEETFKSTGSYAVTLPRANIRLIFINSVYCLRLNLWNFIKPYDLGGQLDPVLLITDWEKSPGDRVAPALLVVSLSIVVSLLLQFILSGITDE